MLSYCAPPTIRSLWPTPQLGEWAVRDVSRTVPVAGMHGFGVDEENLPQRETASDRWKDTGIGAPIDRSESQTAEGWRARRGAADRGEYAEQTFNSRISPVVQRSLAREPMYNWADAQFNVGGVTYPFDYGYGPGAHYDASDPKSNPQTYMRPGIYRRQLPKK